MQLPGLRQNLSSAVILGRWFGSFILPPRVSFILIAYPLPMPGMAVTRGESLSCDVYQDPTGRLPCGVSCFHIVARLEAEYSPFLCS